MPTDLREIPDDPVVPGAPAPVPHEPRTSREIAWQRLDNWVAQIDAMPEDRRRHLRPEDLAAVQSARVLIPHFRSEIVISTGQTMVSYQEIPATLAEAVQEAWSRLFPDGRVTEAELLDCFADLTRRVCCPACGGYQVYDLVDACWSCGKAEREGRVGGWEPGVAGERAPADEYDPDVRVWCADPKCVQWASACSKCGAKVRVDKGKPILRDDKCPRCKAPWPRTRTRWKTAPLGVCGGRDGYDPNTGCGWRRA